MLARLLKNAPDPAPVSEESAAMPEKPRFLLEAEAESRAARKARAEIEARYHELLAARDRSGSHLPAEIQAVQRQLDAATATVADARAAVARARKKFGPMWRAEVEPVVEKAEHEIREALAIVRRHVDLLCRISDTAEANGELPRPGLAKKAGELRAHLQTLENIAKRS